MCMQMSSHLCLLEGSLSCCAGSTAMGCGGRLLEIRSDHFESFQYPKMARTSPGRTKV